MTNSTNNGHTADRVVAALAAVAPDLAPLPAGGWEFTLANGWPVGVRARIVDSEWLELATGIKGAGLKDADQAWRLLTLNAHLAGAPRVAATRDGGLVLRGEASVGTDGVSADESDVRQTDVGDLVHQLCDDFRAALHQLHGSNGAPSGDIGAVNALGSPGDGSSADGNAATRLAALCVEAGWAATERTSGEVAVIVETRHAAYRARLTLGAGDSFQALVPFSDVELTTMVGRAATARLLLRLSGAVRLVKGVVVRDGEAVRPGIAAASAPPRTGADMARVLSALSVACGLAGREIRALTDQGLARAYLALGGPQGDVVGNTKKDHVVESRGQLTNEEERVCLL